MLTVPTLEGESIEDFSIRVVEAWKLGQADLDNGALLLVAPSERAVRVEVGYGLEGSIPDARARRILADHVLPRFRSGDYAAGITAGVEALMAAARGEALPAARRRSRGGPASPLAGLLFAGFLGGTLATPMRRRARLRGTLLGGVLSGLIGWLLLPGLAWVLGAAALGALLGGSASRAPSPGGRWGGVFPGAFRSGGGGFGGFSGGGGGFGGGGASGSW